MNQIEKGYTEETFEDIKHIDEYGNEYWLARELQKVLEYKDWRNFEKVIKKSVVSAENSISQKGNWVVEVNKPINTGKGKQEYIKDYIQGEKEAKDVHYEVGKKVRKAIADIGGMMPEEMPTPEKSLKELEREKKKLETKYFKNLEETK